MTTTTMMTITTNTTTMKQRRKGDASLFACRTRLLCIEFCLSTSYLMQLLSFVAIVTNQILLLQKLLPHLQYITGLHFAKFGNNGSQSIW